MLAVNDSGVYTDLARGDWGVVPEPRYFGLQRFWVVVVVPAKKVRRTWPSWTPWIRAPRHSSLWPFFLSHGGLVLQSCVYLMGSCIMVFYRAADWLGYIGGELPADRTYRWYTAQPVPDRNHQQMYTYLQFVASTASQILRRPTPIII